MRVAVIGAGVIGVTTAYELTLNGHEVTVFERRGTAAEEASFANGSLIAPGWLASVAQIGSPSHRLWANGAGPGWPLTGWPSPSQWKWLWQSQRARRAPQQAKGLATLSRLAQLSQDRLVGITTNEQLNFDRSQGLLVLLRTDQEAELARLAFPALREQGVSIQELDAAQARRVEPSLNPATPLAGALALPNDFSANCRQFTLHLKSLAQARGCVFQFGREVLRLEAAHHGVTLTLSAGHPTPPSFDATVLCSGSAGATLLRPHGVRLPMQTVYGHSVNAQVREPMDAPMSAVIDARQQLSITRLGQRIRVAGGAHLGGAPGRPSVAAIRRLYGVLMDWFPGAARLGGPHGSVQEWRGAQALLSDGLPLLGESGVPRVWLNLAHGSSGWTLACGCAQALADQIQGRAPAVDLAPFSPGRFKA